MKFTSSSPSTSATRPLFNKVLRPVASRLFSISHRSGQQSSFPSIKTRKPWIDPDFYASTPVEKYSELLTIYYPGLNRLDASMAIEGYSAVHKNTIRRRHGLLMRVFEAGLGWLRSRGLYFQAHLLEGALQVTPPRTVGKGVWLFWFSSCISP